MGVPITTYTFSGIPFFNVGTRKEREKTYAKQVKAYKTYLDFTDDQDKYVIKSTWPNGGPVGVYTFYPRFVGKMREKDIFFPHILADSPILDNGLPPLNFIALELGRLETDRCDVNVSDTSSILVSSPMIELLLDKEIVFCLEEDLKLVTPEVLASIDKTRLVQSCE